MVNGKCRNITDDDLILAASSVNIGSHEVREIIACVDSAVAEFKLLS